MDSFDLKPERKYSWKTLFWNVLTIIVLGITFLLAVYFLALYLMPNSFINPFRPVPSPTAYQSPTPTVTLIPQDSTWTPTTTNQPSPSRTKAPTWTLPPELITPPTPTGTFTEATPTTTSSPMPATATVKYSASTDIHPERNCNWMGVGGRVMGIDGTPLKFQEITLGGTLDGKVIDYVVLSGMVSASAYGTSGFEFDLGDHPIASTHTLWIQLLDNTAKQLSDKIFFDTFAECSKNLVTVVFIKNR
jgi:hypothetical protein